MTVYYIQSITVDLVLGSVLCAYGISTIFQLYRSSQYYLWSNPVYQVTDTYTSPSSVFELTTLVVIGTDYIGSYKSNNHTIMTMTTL